MAPVEPSPAWWRRTRVLFAVGKGGVGSSTVAAATAVLAADHGADVLLVAVDGKPGLGRLLGGDPLGPSEQVLRTAAGGGRVRGRTVTAQQAFGDYLSLKGFGGVLRRAAAAASFDVIAGSTPGMEHLLVLGKIKELERERAADLIVVDAPPAGHAAPFLRAAAALQSAVASGPVREQADEVVALLEDQQRTQCVVVTLPEEGPVTEAIELAHELGEGAGDGLGMALAPIVVNACWPHRAGLDLSVATAARRQQVTLGAAAKRALETAATFGRARQSAQEAQFERLAREVALDQIHLPRLPVARMLPEHLDQLAGALGGIAVTSVPT